MKLGYRLYIYEFQKWHSIRACLPGSCGRMDGMGGVLAWVARVVCLREWRASVGGVGGMLAWIARASVCSVSGMGGVKT